MFSDFKDKLIDKVIWNKLKYHIFSLKKMKMKNNIFHLLNYFTLKYISIQSRCKRTVMLLIQYYATFMHWMYRYIIMLVNPQRFLSILVYLLRIFCAQFQNYMAIFLYHLSYSWKTILDSHVDKSINYLEKLKCWKFHFDFFH